MARSANIPFSSLSPRCPALPLRLAPPWGQSSSPSPGLSSQVTPRGLGQRLLLPHALLLFYENQHRQRAAPCHNHSSSLPTSFVGVSSPEAASQAGEFAALTPARGLPSCPSLTGRRLRRRWWHRWARAAAVDDVVGDARILGDAEHIVPGAGARVPHQEHPVPLALQQRHRLLPAQPPPVPATPLLRVEVARHGRLRAYTLGRRRRARPSNPGVRRPADRLRSQSHSSARNGGGGRGPSPPEMTLSLPLGGCRERDHRPPLGEGQGTPRARLRMRPHGRRRLAGTGTAENGKAESRVRVGASTGSLQGILSVPLATRFFAPSGFKFLEGPRLQGSDSKTIGIEKIWPWSLTTRDGLFLTVPSASPLPGHLMLLFSLIHSANSY